MIEQPEGLQEWINSRPPKVQSLIKEFPFGTRLLHNGTLFYLFGYTEGDCLIMSTIDPYEDYDGAFANREYICAKHLREAELVS